MLEERLNVGPYAMLLRSHSLVTKIGFAQSNHPRLLAYKHDAALARVVHEFAATQLATSPALIGISESLDYSELSAQANRYARWALRERLAVGEVVALDLSNRSEYAAIWLGLTQVDVW